MRADQFLEQWSGAIAAVDESSHRVWAERFCREGSALMVCPGKDGARLLLLIATDRAAEQVLEFVVRKAFAIERFERIWEPSSQELLGVDAEVFADLGIGVWQAYRVSEEARDHADGVFKQLTVVERNRLPSTVQWSASTGSLIRSLRGAVDRGDREAVEAHLSELKGRALADRFHFDFLSLWSKAKLEPGSVAASSELHTVLDRGYSVPVPKALLQVVAGAALDSEVARPGEDGAGGSDFVARLREVAAPFPSALVQRGCLLPSAEGAVFRALSSIGGGALVLWSGDEELIRERVGSDLLAELPAATPKPDPEPLVSDPREDDSRLLALLRELAAGVDDPDAVSEEAVLQLTEFALRGDGYVTKELREWWSRLAPASQTKWASRSDILADWLEVPEESGVEGPASWLGWLQMLAAGEASPDDAGSGFSYSDLPLFEGEQNPDWAALDEVLKRLVGEDEFRPRLLEVMPALLEAWGGSRFAESHLDRVSQSLAEVLVFGVLISEDALSARHGDALISRFFEIGLARGLSAQAYEAVVNELADRVKSLHSPGLLRALIEIFELLTDEKRPHLDSFLGCALAFSQAASRLHGRMGSDELRLIAELLSLAGMAPEAESLEALLPEEEEAADLGDPGVSLAGKKVLIYTLVEGAGSRAKARIEQSLQAEVRLNHDHSASAALKGDLEWADIVISVTRAAQHAATGEIDRQTEKDVLIRPPGKGSSSIWNALNDWRRKQSA